MIVTVATLLEQAIHGEAKVIAGYDQIDTKRVHWISLLDLTTPPGTRVDEFVICINATDDIARLVATIHAAAAAGAAALAFHVSPEVVPLVRVAAEAIYLPVIALPADLTPQKMSYQLLEWFLQNSAPPAAIHQQWLQYLLDGATLEELLQALASYWQRSVLILDHTGYPLAHAGAHGQQLVARLAYWHAHHLDDGLPILLPDDQIFVTPINTSQGHDGNLITSYRGSLPTYQEREMVQQALLAVGLAMQQQAGHHLHTRRQSDLVWDLATGHAQDESEAQRWGQTLGFEVQAPMYAIVGQVESTIATDVSHLLDVLSEEMAATRVRFIGAAVPQHIILFVTMHEPGVLMKPTVEHICHYLSQAATLTFSWGVSDIHAGLAAFAKNYQDACFACQIGTLLHGVGNITFAAHIASYRLLHKVSQEPDSRQFWEHHLGGLVQAESRKSADLLETLEVYLATQCNASETARQLGLHRQTLNYRLQRIEEITGRRLDDPQERFALELSARLYRLHPLRVRHHVGAS